MEEYVFTSVKSTGYKLLILETDDGKTVRREGGTVAWRCNNPGNLKFSPFSQNLGAIGKDINGHAVFPTIEHGNQARYTLLFLDTSRYFNRSLYETISIYAPASDGNDVDWYVSQIERTTGINRNTRLCDLSPEQRNKLLESMKTVEGFQAGSERIEE